MSLNSVFYIINAPTLFTAEQEELVGFGVSVDVD